MQTYPSPKIASSQAWLTHLPLFIALSLLLGQLVLLLSSPSPTFAASRITDMYVDVVPVLSLTNAHSVINISIDNPETFYTADTTLTASTNNPTGYQLTMSSANPDSTDLLNTDSSDTIPSITTDITLTDSTGANFPTNKWGYSLGTAPLNYKIIPTHSTASPIRSTNTAKVDDATSVNFGVKTSRTLDAGIYSGTVTFTLTANPQELKTLSNLTYLQDLADHPTYCANSTVGETVLLTDKRDSKQYRVRKLKDNNCWMIDNLRLGSVGQDLTLTQQDSDVATDVTIPTSAIVNSDGQGSWAGPGTSTDESFYKNWHVYQREDTTYGGTKTAPTVSGNRYGSLYNWHTATAGTSDFDAAQGTNMTSSICPKGWRLPDGWSISADRPKTFQALYDQYNTQAEMTETETGTGPEFVLSGYVSEGGSLANVGTGGGYWSRTAYGWYSSNSRWNAYRPYLNASAVLPQGDGNQMIGFSVRCVSAQ